MRRDEYIFIKGLEARSSCSSGEASHLRDLYGKYISETRMRMLTSTCSSCVSEMFSDMVAYTNKPDLKITEQDEG